MIGTLVHPKGGFLFIWHQFTENRKIEGTMTFQRLRVVRSTLIGQFDPRDHY